jgi:ABC-type long-subunit fatty acid transport system fused permease/ATPase subunit
MGALGVSLIVLGLAFVFSGLVFLLPTGRKPPDLDTFEKNQRRTALYLQEMRNGKDQPKS